MLAGSETTLADMRRRNLLASVGDVGVLCSVIVRVDAEPGGVCSM